jgi:peroxiredoxin
MKCKPLLMALALSLALLVLLVACEKKEESAPLKKGGPAPDFALKDMGGELVRLSDLKGKVVLMEFWATWCPPCKMAIPELNELQARHEGSNLAILAISIDENREIVEDFMEENEMSFTVLYDDEGVVENYGVYTIPTTLVIDARGNVVEHHMGYAPGIFEQLLEEVELKESK